MNGTLQVSNTSLKVVGATSSEGSSSFWATVCKTVHPMLSDRCLSVCPVCL